MLPIISFLFRAFCATVMTGWFMEKHNIHSLPIAFTIASVLVIVSYSVI